MKNQYNNKNQQNQEGKNNIMVDNKDKLIKNGQIQKKVELREV